MYITHHLRRVLSEYNSYHYLQNDLTILQYFHEIKFYESKKTQV